MDPIKLECPNCKAPLSAERSRSHMFCEYCGSKIALDDIRLYHEDAVTERHRISEQRKVDVEREREKGAQAARESATKLAIALMAMMIAGALALILSH